jgi:predicted HAD superfamily Cof-like phosphohydrolase
MTSYMQRAVQDFHEAMGSTVGEYPGIRDAELRAKLILEEAAETAAALGYDVHVLMWDPIERDSTTPPDWNTYHDGERHVIDAIDGLADILYVVFGTAVAMGIDLSPFFDEVHRSNMTKVGGEKRADGKVLKPETYEPPNLLPELIHQQLAASVDA